MIKLLFILFAGAIICGIIALLFLLKNNRNEHDIRFRKDITILKSLLNDVRPSEGAYIILTQYLEKIVCYGEEQKEIMDEIITKYKIKYVKFISDETKN